MVFVKYVYNGVYKEEFLFCSSLETNTKAAHIFEKVSSFLNLSTWNGRILLAVAQMESPQYWAVIQVFKLL